MKPTRDEVTFVLANKERNKALLFAIIMPLWIIAYLAIFEWIESGQWEDVITIISQPLSWGIVVFFWLLLAPFAYWVNTRQRSTLVFQEKAFKRTGFRALRTYQGPVAYDDVVRIGRRTRGQLVIEQADGKDFILGPKAYEGGSEAIFSELRRRIPADKFDEDIEKVLYQKTGREWRGAALSFAGVALIMGYSFFDALVERAGKDLAWTTEVEVNFRTESIEDFDFDQDGSLWLLVRDSSGEYNDPQSYQVRHIISTGAETLQFPSTETLFPEGPPEFGPSYPQNIRLSGNNQLMVYFFLIDSQMVWTGREWMWEEPRGITSFLQSQLAGPNREYWEKIIESRAVQAINPSTGDVEEISLGEEIGEWTFGSVGFAYGWRVVRLHAPDEQIYVLAYQNDPSEGMWTKVEMGGRSLVEYLDLRAYAPGPAGEIYVLVRQSPACENDLISFTVGRLKNGSEMQWIWRTLQFPQVCKYAIDPDEFIVDVRARIWIDGTNKVVAYDPSVFDKPQAGPEDLIIYTEKNSGYYSSLRLRLRPDGRLWSLDNSGEALVWLDPDVDNLEEPLPGWVNQAADSIWTLIIPFVAGMILLILGATIAQNDSYLRCRNS